MIKIVIVTKKMVMGGVERALINLLNSFASEQVSIDLIVQEFGGELEYSIPQWIQKYEMKPTSWKYYFRHWRELFHKLIYLWKLKYSKLPYIEQCMLSSRMYDSVDKEYDIAISYHAPNTIPVFFTIDKIKAKRKILWLHGNLAANDGTTELAKHYYRKYDKIFSVAKYIQQELEEHLPEKKKDLRTIHNMFYPEIIREKAEHGKGFSDEFDGVRILSIGRLDYQKGFDIAVGVCKKLVEHGYKFRWYVCGDGEERSNLENLIKTYNLSNSMILLGNQDNPYRFLKECDLYVQPSRCEGFCTTTNEAKALWKPVVTTMVSGAKEQFIDGNTGWIVEISEEAIYERIKLILDDMNEAKRIVDNLKKMIDFKNVNMEEVIEQLVGECNDKN